MKRWIFTEGARDITGLRFESAPIPRPGPGEVRIRVHAVSLNSRDQMILEAPELRTKSDLIPLSDGSGEIDAIGEGVSTWRIGDRVVSVFFAEYFEEPPPVNLTMGLGCLGEDGMMAQFVVLPATRVVRAPPSLTMVEAATLPCAALTACNALQGSRPIAAGDKVLVLGAGNVSLFALAFARIRGAEVFATTGHESKRERLAGLGVRAIVNYQDEPDWGHAISQLSGGVDRVLNTVGTGALAQSMAALRPGGEVAFIGATASDDNLDTGKLMAKGAVIRGIAVGSQAAFGQMSSMIESTQFKPRVARVLGLGDLKAAFLEQASPSVFGKVVLSI